MTKDVRELVSNLGSSYCACRHDADEQIEQTSRFFTFGVLLMNSLIQASEVTYEYEGTSNGVHDVSFRACEGDLVAVVGRNGSGKTTLLNLLAGIVGPASGTLSCDDGLTYHDFGICPQRQSIDWYLSVRDNVMLGALLAGMRGPDAREATGRALDLLDLSSMAERDPDSLSGGQQQRLQVARALVHSPRMLVLDEPTTGLDFVYSERLFGHLRERASDGAVAFVSSHDLDSLEGFCNKILLLVDGRMRFFGDMGAFLASHQTAREVRVCYSGSLGEKTASGITSLGARLEDGSVVIAGDAEGSLGAVLELMLGKVDVTSVTSSRVGLKDAVAREGECS